MGFCGPGCFGFCLGFGVGLVLGVFGFGFWCFALLTAARAADLDIHTMQFTLVPDLDPTVCLLPETLTVNSYD